MNRNGLFAGLAVMLITGVVLAQVNTVKDGRSTDYSTPVSGKTTSGSRLPIPLTADGGALPSACFPSSSPDGYRRTFSGIIRLTDCASAGTTTATITATCSECEAFDERLGLCASGTCTDGGGIPFGVGSRRKLCFDASQAVSCWSTSGTADLVCTPIN